MLSGVLNSRVTKQKNLDLKAKINSWKQRDQERKRKKKDTMDKGAQIRASFEKFLHIFESEREPVTSC